MDEIGWLRQRATKSIVAQGLLPTVIGIADTGFIVAFANKRDEHHRWAVELSRKFSRPLLTCESVLSEVAFHLRRPGVVFDLLDVRLIELRFQCSEHLDSLEAIARRFADRRPDFADLCLIRMSELYPDHPIITIDRADFRIYRRNTREPIPIVCPPEKL